MLSLELKGVDADMTSGNPRKERHGQEDGALALDLDFSCEVLSDVLNQLSLGDEVDYDNLLYDEDGQVKNTGIKRLVFARELEDHDLELKISKRKFDFTEVTVKKISAEPIFGTRVKLSFQAQLHPDDKQIGPVLEGLVHGCKLTIGPGDPLPEGEEEEEGQEETAET